MPFAPSQDIHAVLQDNLSCPIMHDLFQDPVIAADGHTYERAAIERWIQTRGSRAISPLTGVALPHLRLQPNIIVKKLIDGLEEKRRMLEKKEAQTQAAEAREASAEAASSAPTLFRHASAQKEVAKKRCESEVDAFVQLVLDGEQDKADAMLKANPALALGKGSGEEKSGRKWQDITGFQFAVWALDWRMWVMIRGHMEKAGYGAHVKSQLEAQEALSIQQGHGAHFDFGPLLQAYDRSKGYYGKKKWSDCDRCFVEEIGGAQRLLPVHVAQEYCTPDMPFYPVGDFSATSIIRVLEVWWFIHLGSTGGAQVTGGPVRWSGSAIDRVAPDHGWIMRGDAEAVSKLSICRTAQLEALQTELGYIDTKKHTQLAANQGKTTGSTPGSPGCLVQ